MNTSAMVTPYATISSRLSWSPFRVAMSFAVATLLALAACIVPEASAQATGSVPSSAEAPNLRTPRDAVAGFLDATGRRDYVRAAAYLDLRRLPEASRAQDGPVLARQLRIVLDQALAPDLDTLSDQPEGSRREGLSADRERVGTITGKSGSTAIVLQRLPGEGDARAWKISSATVRQIPRLYREFGYGPLGEYLPPVFFELRFLDLAL